MEHVKEFFAGERAEGHKAVGVSRKRTDIDGHVTGRTQYYADRTFPGMLHVKMVRSPHHHAKILSVDTREAEKVPGVVRILTHKDVPKNVYTILCLIQVEPDDEPCLAVDKVRYRGEQIVAVIAESATAAQEAVAKVKVEYEVLPAVFDVEEALEPGAPLVNEYHGQNYFKYEGHHCRRVRFGDVEKAFAEADHVIEERYQSSPIEHAATETTGCIVVPDANGRYVCHSNTQALFFTLDNAALILAAPFQKLRLVGGTVGGGFGGKVDVIVEPIAFLAAMLTNRPVKYAYSREEEMQVSSPRAAERIYVKDGVMKDGRIVARQVRLYVDSGAYSRHSPYGTTKAAAHMPGPYSIPNVHVDAHCVYTNRTPSSAMRGFGVTIGDFAIEVQMDKLARLVGQDPIAFRMRNAYRDGDMKAHGETTHGAALIETMQAASKLANWPLSESDMRASSTARETEMAGGMDSRKTFHCHSRAARSADPRTQELPHDDPWVLGSRFARPRMTGGEMWMRLPWEIS